jgi:hypothetical protein
MVSNKVYEYVSRHPRYASLRFGMQRYGRVKDIGMNPVGMTILFL